MELAIGQKAPDFQVLNQNNELISLNSFEGKKILLYFYPKDSTPGCTAQACNLRDNKEQLSLAGYEIIGVSCDSIESHTKFIKKQDLNFTLLSDNEHVLVNLYGVWGEKSMYGKTSMGIKRTTFLLNEDRIITAIINKVDTKEHTAQVLKTNSNL